MRIVSVGTFLLPTRFSLPQMLTGGRDDLAKALTAEFSEFSPVGDLEASELLYDYHRGRGAQWLPSALFSGETAVPELGTIQLHLTTLAVGFVIVTYELPDEVSVDLDEEETRQEFKRYEQPVSNAVAPLIAQWARRAVAAAGPAIAQAAPEAALPSGKLLWWHRVAEDPRQGKEFPSAFYYGQRAELAKGAEYVVGDGFSYLRHRPVPDRDAAAPPEPREAGPWRDLVLLPDVVEGLMLATQEWLIVDEAKRLLTVHLVELSRAHADGYGRVESQYQDVLVLTEEVTLRNLVMSEESRYLTNARRRAKEAAARAWNIADEVAQLEERTCALRDLLALHRERVTSSREDRRNRYIFVFTGVALVQATLVWYDFLTEDDVTVAAAPRPAISLSVLVFTLLVLTGAMTFDPLRRAARRLWRSLAPRLRGSLTGGDGPR